MEEEVVGWKRMIREREGSIRRRVYRYREAW